MESLDVNKLEQVCRSVAKITMWQTPKPSTMEDIITADDVDQVVSNYMQIAKFLSDSLKEIGEDPNIVVIAVDFLALTKADAAMRSDGEWFYESLFALLLLARPEITGFEPVNHPFLDEVLKGVEQAKSYKLSI